MFTTIWCSFTFILLSMCLCKWVCNKYWIVIVKFHEIEIFNWLKNYLTLFSFHLNLIFNIKFRYEGLYCQIPQECPPNFYGPNCTVQCYAPNSCSAGHFSCNSNGSRTCLPGWSPTSTCLIKNISSYLDPECPVSTGCLNGGSCFNGSCCCPSTYTGKYYFLKKTLLIYS